MRKRINFESVRRRNRVKPLRFINPNHNAIKQDIFQSRIQATHWLMRNDKEWLTGKLPKTLPLRIRKQVSLSERTTLFY